MFTVGQILQEGTVFVNLIFLVDKDSWWMDVHVQLNCKLNLTKHKVLNDKLNLLCLALSELVGICDSTNYVRQDSVPISFRNKRIFLGFFWWLSYGSDNSKVLCASISQKRRGWVTGLPLHSKSSSSATCPVSWLPRQKIQRTERGVATALRGAVPRWREVGAGAIVGATHWVDKRPREGCRTPSLKKAYPALPWRLSYSL